MASSSLETRKIGVDPGFGGLKAAEANGTGLSTYHIPAQVGVMTNTNQIGLGGFTNSGTSVEDPMQVQLSNGSSYLVGHGIASYTKPIPRMDFNRFSDSIELRANLYGLLSLIFPSGKHDASILLTLPVETLRSDEEATQVERGIKSWLIGQHEFFVDNSEYSLNIHRVRCKMPQPVAIWCDWGFTPQGTWYRGAEALKAPYLIIDPGFNTLDLVLIQNRRVVTRLSGGDKLGMRVAAKELQTVLKNRYMLEFDIYQSDAIIQEMVIKGKVSTYVGGKSIDITSLAQQALDSLKADSLSFIESSIKNAAASKNIMGGGGAVALGPMLYQQLKGNLEILDDPVLAGARGSSKIAARKGFLD